MKLKVKLVYGAPCSGKSSYVRANTSDNDLVFDYDRLIVATTNRIEHLAKPHALHWLILDLRKNFVDLAQKYTEVEFLYLICSWKTDYISNLLEGVEVEEIFIEATKSECYERLEQDETRPDKDDWRKLIDKWFEVHTENKWSDRIMKKSDELRQAVFTKKKEVENLRAALKISEASNAAKELQKLNNELQVEIALEETEFQNFLKTGAPLETTSTVDAAKLRNRAFNKLVFKLGELTDEERGAYFNVTGSPGTPGQVGVTPNKGGYLVPAEQMATIQEFRKDFIALKDYVSVVSTNTTSGRWATYTPQDLEFQTFSELADIAESDVSFGEATYLIEDRGMILPISNQLISDANVDVISFLGRQLAEGAVKTENKAILQPLETLITGDTAASIAEATTITSYKSLNTAMFKTLDGAYLNAAKIFTNQDGFLWLSNIDDGTTRPLLQPDVTEPHKYFYRGKEIVVIPNSTLPNKTISSKNYAPFFVGDLRSYITLFERQGMELATSSELYFRKYGTALRAVIRFGVVVADPFAMTALKVEV